MDQNTIKRQVTKDILLQTKKETGQAFVPAAVSARHVHLAKADVEALFGPGHQLTSLRDLSQPGQFACKEQVEIEGPKGRLKARVLGPERPDTQVEISVTDAVGIGIKPVTRMSGDVQGAPGAKLVGPAGSVDIPCGVMISARHLHISPQQAEVYGLQDGQQVSLRSGGERSVVFEKVVVRVGKGHDLEVHLDFDEANCALIKNGDLMEIIK